MISSKLVMLCLISVLTLSISTYNTNHDDGLIAYYSFNHCDARDESGNGSHGELYGSIACWCGIDDNGLLLDGVNDYIAFPGKVNRYFTTSDFTLSFYIKAERYMLFEQSLLSKRRDCEAYNMFDLTLNMHKRTVIPKVHETPNKYYSNLETRIDTTAWFHFVLVREGTHAYTYINGKLMQKSFRCSGVDISNEAVLSFSNSPCIQSGKARRFKGVLDELRVYDRALSTEEVEELYLRYPVENALMDCVT
jgi:hypothetical protein